MMISVKCVTSICFYTLRDYTWYPWSPIDKLTITHTLSSTVPLTIATNVELGLFNILFVQCLLCTIYVSDGQNSTRCTSQSNEIIRIIIGQIKSLIFCAFKNKQKSNEIT